MFGETVAESQLGGTESGRDIAVIQGSKGRGHSLNSSPLYLGVPVLPVRQSDHRNHGATSDDGNAQETVQGWVASGYSARMWVRSWRSREHHLLMENGSSDEVMRLKKVRVNSFLPRR